MNYPFAIYDAHNHLQDQRFASQLPAIIEALESIPVRGVVVNGTRAEDWPLVMALAAKHPWVIPSIGLHPWYLNDRKEGWDRQFEELLDTHPCAVGEIGLDRWIDGYDIDTQEEVFRFQLRQAARRNLPVSIHCLKAWGALYDVLRGQKLPSCGFLLHSYGGPAEMIKEFSDLGAYFSLSGYFAHERKKERRDAFKQVPLDRILLETDSPDMLPPPSHQLHFISDSTGADLNHPANIPAIYEFASELYHIPMEELASNVEVNFQRLFYSVLRRNTGRDG